MNEKKAIWTVHHRRDICGVHESDPELVEADTFLKGLEAGRAEARPLVDALKEVVAVLGPEPADCGCDGCSTEMEIAIRVSSEALKAYRTIAREQSERNAVEQGEGEKK